MMKNMVKKVFVLCAVVVAVSLASGFTTPTSVSAADDRGFLGLVPWYQNTIFVTEGTPTNEEAIQSSVWIAVANVTTDITVIATYLVIGYVIYGGYLYIFSSGDPNKVASGKKTLYHAFLGLAIVLLAGVILNSIRIALGGANFVDGKCAVESCTTPGDMVSSAITWFIGIAGFVSAIFIVYGGISYITSSGDPSKLQKAKSMILYALIGLAIVGLSLVIVSFVQGAINDSNREDDSKSYVQPNMLHDQYVSLKTLPSKIVAEDSRTSTILIHEGVA